MCVYVCERDRSWRTHRCERDDDHPERLDDVPRLVLQAALAGVQRPRARDGDGHEDPANHQPGLRLHYRAEHEAVVHAHLHERAPHRSLFVVLYCTPSSGPLSDSRSHHTLDVQSGAITFRVT